VGIEVVLFALLGHRIATESDVVLEGRPPVAWPEDRVVDAVALHLAFDQVELQIPVRAEGNY
jgi:hypothetical protein